jgi:hypothetical protein
VSPNAARISPTAHYTGYVWARNGLSHPGLITREGRVLFASLQPAMLASRAVGGATLEARATGRSTRYSSARSTPARSAR